MTPQEIQTIHDLLANRVVPQSAREGAAIMALAQKLVREAAPAMVVHPTQPPNPTPDPTPDPPSDKS